MTQHDASQASNNWAGLTRDYPEMLDAVIAELQLIAKMPPAEAALALGELTVSGETGIRNDLAEARSAAVRAVYDELGTVRKAAAVLGISGGVASRLAGRVPAERV